MYEDNKKTGLTNFFIKLIIVIIFVIFILWLLSSFSKGITGSMSDINNSLTTLTDNIFSENIDKMKEVGISYFTTERLPQEVGEVKTLTLAEMYEQKLILELKDKDGNACSKENSYVSIEKGTSEYQMKVYLECGEESDYVIVILGCYNYCDTDVCEKKEETTTDTTQLQYEYKKTTGGSWSDYGEWSEWSKVSVTENNYRDVETKTVEEEYTYNKVVSQTVYDDYSTSCPSGYTLSSDGTKCYKTTTSSATADLTCPTVSGWTYVSRDGTTCNYEKTVSVAYQENETVAKTCTKDVTVAKTCTRDVPKTVSQTCTRNVEKTGTKTCYKNETKTVYSCTGCAPRYQVISVPYSCSYTYTDTESYDCSYTTTETESYDCSYTETQEYDCSYTQEVTKYKTETQTHTETATCPDGYSYSNGTCYKTTSKTESGTLNKTCADGYTLTTDGTKCYTKVDKNMEVKGTRTVTYYRYRLRKYTGGTTTYKWSNSNNDSDLINAGYTLTGNTKSISSK